MPLHNASHLFTRQLLRNSTYLFSSGSRKGQLRGILRRQYSFWDTCSSRSRGPGRESRAGSWCTGPRERIGQRQEMTKPDLEKQYMSSKAEKKAIAEPRPSSSIILLSPQNKILLLHRVKTSSSFPSAHVFPGGNLSPEQDGDIPGVGEESKHENGMEGRHTDGRAYRMAGARECFEECGILLARKGGNEGQEEMLDLGVEERERARKEIHAGRLGFKDWVEGRGGVADLENLIPFTRWITPPNLPRRFTTQMYIYFLPLSTSSTTAITPIPTHDGGLEHTTAEFKSCAHWIDLASKNEIILFPPQYYLMYLLAPFLSSSSSVPSPSPESLSIEQLQNQRTAILNFLQTDDGSGIKWADKVISPKGLLMTKDGRSVLGLENPGPELESTGRGGDGERVVLVRFKKEGPRDVEVRSKKEVFEEERGRGKL